MAREGLSPVANGAEAGMWSRSQSGDSAKDCWKVAEKDVISDPRVLALQVCNLASGRAAEPPIVCKMLCYVLLLERVQDSHTIIEVSGATKKVCQPQLTVRGHQQGSSLARLMTQEERLAGLKMPVSMETGDQNNILP